jgi:hypothetical protein
LNKYLGHLLVFLAYIKEIDGSRSKNILCTTIFPENLAVYEIMWGNMIKPAGHTQQYNAEHALSMLNKEDY